MYSSATREFTKPLPGTQVQSQDNLFNSFHIDSTDRSQQSTLTLRPSSQMLSNIRSTPATSNIHANAAFTSKQHVDGPISKLHHDLLECIFMINADLWTERTTSESALTITRLTSQVCHQWREIILNSPSIWANIIDLRVLVQPSDDWRNEVMRRTGQTPLSIRADVLGGYDPSMSFFLFLTEEHWERIRRLEVRVLVSIDPEKWTPLRCPAPSLEYLQLSFSSCPDPSSLINEDKDKFLSGHAPLLREFHCPQVTFSPFAPWIPQLRALTMSSPSSISDLFSVLENTPVLESLEIQPNLQIQADAPVAPSRKIDLSRLNFIYLQDTFRICLSILKRVFPSPRCVLNLLTEDYDLADVPSEEDLHAFQVILFRYSVSYFNFVPTTKLSLYIDHTVFSVAGPTQKEPFASTFRTAICCRAINMPPDNFRLFLGSFSSCNFSSVTTFELSIFRGHETFQSDIIRFISSLPAVEVLQATKNAVRILLEVQQEGRHLFPSLHTLTLAYRETIHSTTLPPFASILLSYLALRRDAGFPIKLLDLKDRPLGNLECLEHMTGLKVHWKNENKRDEYVCGDGSSQILDFR